MKKCDVGKSIDLALDFLADSQKKDGSFDSMSSSSIDNFDGARKYQTIFANGLILLCLNYFSGEKAERVRSKLADFLYKQKSANWLYGYWVRDSQQSRQLAVPMDMDDTFVVLGALLSHNQNIFKPRDYAQITSILTDLEVQEGGPYRTWWVDDKFDKKWLDVDVAVNANIAYFLYLNEINLPNLSKFFDEAIDGWQLKSKYYPNEYSTIYYLSRFYDGNGKQKIISWLKRKKKKNGSWGNSLNTALAILSLINLGTKDSVSINSIERLLSSQKEGIWPACGFCLDPMIDQKKYYSGSPALTTAFCLLSLKKYLDSKFNKNNISGSKKTPEISRLKGRYKKIISLAKKEFGKLTGCLRRDCNRFLKEMIKKDEDGEIVLLPLVVATSLSEKIDQKKVTDLCLASLYGWMAYTLYDDFLDEESEGWMLPVANVCMNRLSCVYSNLKNEEIYRWYCRLIDQMEQANSWEINNARIKGRTRVDAKKVPSFGDLQVIANKSIGHSLGGLASMILAGCKPADIENMYDFFHNYLVARQLNDDAHDWENDLKRGQINAVGAMTLRDFFRQTGRRYFLYVRDIDKIRLIFWNKTMNKVSKKIFLANKKARQAIGRVKTIEDNEFYLNRLARLDASAQMAIDESGKVKEFIDNY